jgi:hypothetical protein
LVISLQCTKKKHTSATWSLHHSLWAKKFQRKRSHWKVMLEVFLTNPVVTPIYSEPEWYFMFARTILKFIPNELEGVINLITSTTIMALCTINSFLQVPTREGNVCTDRRCASCKTQFGKSVQNSEHWKMGSYCMTHTCTPFIYHLTTACWMQCCCVATSLASPIAMQFLPFPIN